MTNKYQAPPTPNQKHHSLTIRKKNSVSTGIGSEISKADHVIIRCYTAPLTSKPSWLLTNELKKEATPPDTNGVTYNYSTTHFQNEMRARARWQVSHFYDTLASRHRRK